MLKFLKFCCSFEFLFACFLFAGQFKTDPRFAFFPVDLTLFFFVFSVSAGAVVMLYQFHIPPKILFPLFIFSLFCIFAVSSISWSQSVFYAREKSIKLLALVGWSFLAPLLIIGQSRRRVERFMNVLLLLAIWMALEGLFLVASGHRGFLNITGGNYLGLGRILGISIAIVLSRMQMVGQNIKSVLWYFCLFVLFMLVMLMGGGRGPLIAVLCGWFVTLLLNADFKKYLLKLRISKRTVLKCFVLIAILFTVTLNFEFLASVSPTLSRIKVLFSADGFGASGNARVKHWTSALSLWQENPLIGYGIGSWPLLNDAADHRSYPHNIVLEILVEFGIVGFIPFLLMIYFSIKNTFKITERARKYEGFLLQMLLLVSLLNAMVSGDIPDNRFLFAVMGLCVWDFALTKNAYMLSRGE